MKWLLFFVTLLVTSILLVCMVIKYLHFRNTRRRGWRRFAMSFFKWYPLAMIYSTGSTFKQRFMQYSNQVNCFVWAACLLKAVTLLLLQIAR